jgi:UDP-N-acetylglucosamine 2-epimerase (non-hydrolysing)
MKIITVLGTRPEIIKLSSLIPLLIEISEHYIVHSGQHYSYEMDAVFFKELGLPMPDYSLGVGSIFPAAQVGKIAEGVEKIIVKQKPDWVVVHGDTNTTLGGALAAVKNRHLGIKLAHVEAGARSFNLEQPEEVNRLLVDRMSDLLFAPTEADKQHLLNEAILEQKIIVTGNTVVESCLRMAQLVEGERIAEYPVSSYAVCTIHRQETVDNRETLENVWKALSKIAEKIPIILPIHPRAKKMLETFKLPIDMPGLYISGPMSYKKMITLLKNARFCMTDSGGIQEEAAILGIPTIILRERTEHMRYVDSGIHVLAGGNTEKILQSAYRLLVDDILASLRKIQIRKDTDVSKKIINGIQNYS